MVSTWGVDVTGHWEKKGVIFTGKKGGKGNPKMSKIICMVSRERTGGGKNLIGQGFLNLLETSLTHYGAKKHTQANKGHPRRGEVSQTRC